MRSLAFLLSVFLLYQTAPSQEPIAGPWHGGIRISGTVLEIQVTFRDSSGHLSAAIDIPPQHAYGLRLQNVRYSKPVVHFELPAGPGVAIFDGTYAADSITGIFAQGAALGTFALVPGSLAESPRPIELAPPYTVEEVTFSDSGTVLAGTLTIPATPGDHPGLVLLTGSGAQNRDEDVLGFKIFKLLADTLTRIGMAVLRFDDRGVGGSSGSQTTCTDDVYADDAMAAVDFLRKHSGIDPNRIGLLGHSEGAGAASIAASLHPAKIAFLVLMAGPGLRGDSLINSQIVRLSLALGASRSDVEQSLGLQKEILAAVRGGGDLSRVRDKLRESAAQTYRNFSPSQRSAVQDSATFVSQSADRQITAIETPWFRRFIDLDPTTYLMKVRCPVLAIFGGLDHQVFPDLNKPPVEEALRHNPDVTVVVIPGANHLFQKATTGLPSEYATLPKSFAPGFTDTLTAWLDARLRIGK